MATQDDILIRQYAHDELPPEEVQQFESRLQSEPELLEELQLYLALSAREAVTQKQRWQQMRAIQAPIQVITPVWRSPAVWLSVAAVALVLVALIWLSSRPGPDASKLAGQYLAQTYPPPEIPMGATDSDSLWREAFSAYRNRQFESAVIALTRLAAPNDEQYFYLGLSHLYSQSPNYLAALSALEKAGGNYQEAATFYRALLLIRMGDKEAARSLLEEIREGTRSYEVQKLLRGL